MDKTFTLALVFTVLATGGVVGDAIVYSHPRCHPVYTDICRSPHLGDWLAAVEVEPLHTWTGTPGITPSMTMTSTPGITPGF